MYGAILTSALVGASAVFCAAAQELPVKTHVVTIEGMIFKPEALVVQRGDRVIWVNKDLFPHSATSRGSDFDSKSISPSASWAYVAKKSGDYPYGCSFHPTMKAKLTVR